MKPTDNSSELITHPPDRLFSSGFGSLGVKGLSRTCTSSMTGAIPRVGGLQSAHRKIIGPFFFENENGITVTVNSERYIVILERFWEELEARGRVAAGWSYFPYGEHHNQVVERSFQVADYQ